MKLTKKDASEAAGIAEFVKFAYNMYDNGLQTSHPLTPDADPGFRKVGIDLVYWLNATDSLGPIDKQKRFYGYIAASSTHPGVVILAIRGTRGAEEWLLDFSTLPVPFTPAPKKGPVALGFLSIFDTFEFVDRAGNTTTLQGAITALNTANPINALIVAGHSLGSALATLATAELIFLKVAGIQDNVALWTFASPTVGLLKFATEFNAAVRFAKRIWNVLDIVTWVPPLPYVHVSGLGTPLTSKQELKQLELLVPTPRCEHVIDDYLWLLDRENFAGDKKCVPTKMPTPQFIAGTRALRKGIISSFDDSGAPIIGPVQAIKSPSRPKKVKAKVAEKNPNRSKGAPSGSPR